MLLRETLHMGDQLSGKRLRPQVYVYGRNDMHRRSIDNIGELIFAVAKVTSSLGLDNPLVVHSFSDLSPLEQVKTFAGMDVLVTVQGAHMQNSIFMPSDGVVLEVSPCLAKKNILFSAVWHLLAQTKALVPSDLRRPPINTCCDKYSKNLTLCGRHVELIAAALATLPCGHGERPSVASVKSCRAAPTQHGSKNNLFLVVVVVFLFHENFFARQSF